MIYKTRPQRPHKRTSKYGTEFPAGRGSMPAPTPTPRRVTQVAVRPVAEVMANPAGPGYMADRIRSFHIRSTALNGTKTVRELNIRVRPPSEVLQRSCHVKKGACVRGLPRRAGHCLPKHLIRHRRKFVL